MPHIAISMYAGRSEEEKRLLASAVAAALQTTLNSATESISVSIVDVQPEQWTSTVVEPEILGKKEQIYIYPGYISRPY